MKKLIMLLALLLCLSSVYAFAADNLALNRPVMVSSTTPDAGFKDIGWHKTFINDGKMETGWTSDTQENPSADETEWVRIYLENLYTVDKVILRSNSDLPADIEILLSEDGTWFHPVAHKQTGSFDVKEDVTFTFEPEIAAAVMIRGTNLPDKGADGFLMQIGEAEVYGKAYIPTKGEKLKITNVTSSSSYEMPSETWSRAMIADGNTSTGWTSAQKRYTNTRYCDEWVQLDLGAVYELSYITMLPASQTYFGTDFNIAVSEDGTTFTTIASRYDAGAHAKELLYFSALKLNARYVKYSCSKFGAGNVGPDGYMTQINEISVYGKAVDNTRVRVEKPQLVMAPTETEKVKAFYKDGVSDTFTYESSNENVATVDENGNIQAKAVGYAKITVSGTRGEAASVDVYVEYRDDNIRIIAFWPPTPEYTNGTQYNLMREAYFDSYEGNDLFMQKDRILRSIFFAYENGLYFSTELPGFNPTAQTSEQIRSLFAPYTNLPGIGGIHLKDEPWDPQPYAHAYHVIREMDPSCMASLNFLPPHAYGAYANAYPVMAKWARVTDFDSVISFDNYPFPDNSTAVGEDQLLSNMEIARRVAFDEGKLNTGFYAQSTGKPGGFRWLNVNELRYHINVGLAYGNKQIKYFTYFLPTNRSEDFYGAVISEKGVPTSLYEGAKSVNKVAKGMGHILKNTDAHYVYQAGSFSATEASPIPADFVAQSQNANRFIVSLLKDRTTNRNYLMIVNKNYQGAANASFRLSGVTSVRRVHDTLGIPQETLDFKNGVITTTIIPGGAVLYELNEGYDYNPTPEKTDINLARYGKVKVSGCTYTNGWSPELLNDGILQETSAFHGWLIDNSLADKAHVFIDLNEEQSFDCVELFPAGSNVHVGMHYPPAITIYTSNDGDFWKEVYHESNLDKPTTIALRYYFEETSARYIKLSFPKPSSMMALGEVAVYANGKSVPRNETTYSAQSTAWKEGDNIALKKGISASTSYIAPEGTWKPACLTDGNIKNGSQPGWTSAVQQNFNNTPEWVMVDLNGAYYVEKVVLYPRAEGEGFPTDYKVQLSYDGMTFMDVATVTGDTDLTYRSRTHTFEPTLAKYIRIYGSKLKQVGGDGYLMQLDELQAYGKPLATNLVDSYGTDFSNGLDKFATHPNFNGSSCVPFVVSDGVAAPVGANSQLYYAPNYAGADLIEIMMDVKAPNTGSEPALYMSLFDQDGFNWATDKNYLWIALRGNDISLRNANEWEGDGASIHSSVSIAPYDFTESMQKLSVQMDVTTKTATIYIYDNGKKVKLATIDASNLSNITLTSATTGESVSVSHVKNVATDSIKLCLWAYRMKDVCAVDNVHVYGYRLNRGATEDPLFFVKGVNNYTDRAPFRMEKLFRADELEVMVHSEGGESGFLTIAFYNEEGRLLAVKNLKEGTFEQGENSFVLDLPDTDEPIASIKTLLWKNSGELVPFETYYNIP